MLYKSVVFVGTGSHDNFFTGLFYYFYWVVYYWIFFFLLFLLGWFLCFEDCQWVILNLNL